MRAWYFRCIYVTCILHRCFTGILVIARTIVLYWQEVHEIRDGCGMASHNFLWKVMTYPYPNVNSWLTKQSSNSNDSEVVHFRGKTSKRKDTKKDLQLCNHYHQRYFFCCSITSINFTRGIHNIIPCISCYFIFRGVCVCIWKEYWSLTWRTNILLCSEWLKDFDVC